METKSDGDGILSQMTIDEVRDFDPEVVVLAFASTEPHGPHLPYGTDTIQTEGICRRAVRQANEDEARALLYPTLPIGNNVNFKGFPFACRIGVRTLMDVVLDVIEAVENEGVRKIVIVNGHGGNTAALTAALREHRDRNDPGEGAFVCLVRAYSGMPEETYDQIEHESGHAGELETSRMQYLRPDLVKTDELDEFPIQEPRIEGLTHPAVTFVPRWDAYMPVSAGGETRESSAAKGEAFVEDGAKWIATLLTDLAETPRDEFFPYEPSTEDVPE